MGNYLILHGMDGGAVSRPMSVYQPAIRHHLQLSFDFEGLWNTGARRTQNEQSLDVRVMMLPDGLCILMLISEGSR